jgi:hypothetical protein
MTLIRVRYVRFWESFDKQNNFLSQVLCDSGFEIEVVKSKSESCDIEFVSVYASKYEKFFQAASVIRHRLFGSFQDVQAKYNNLNLPRTKNARRRIWVTGENLRPPYSRGFDGYLSFDQNLLANNAYLPVWYFDAGFFKDHFVTRVGVNSSVQLLTAKRSISKLPPKFACMFVGNPHSVRLQFAEILEGTHPIAKFGAAFGNQVQQKFPIASQFKFTISFENDSYPGYVTEKLLEAYLCKSIPIYWGDLGISSPINPEAILMKRPDQSLEQFAREVIDMPESEILRKLNEPFLKFIPSITDIKHVILGDIVPITYN